MKEMTEDELKWLEAIDEVISSAVLKINRNRLRKYLRNWTTELAKNHPFINIPRKK